MSDDKLDILANKILQNADQDQDNFGSPIAILTIVSIILTCVRIVQECNRSKLSTLSVTGQHDLLLEQIKSLSYRKSWLTKMKIKKILRQTIDKSTYTKYGNILTESLLKTGENITDEDITVIMEQINV